MSEWVLADLVLVRAVQRTLGFCIHSVVYIAAITAPYIATKIFRDAPEWVLEKIILRCGELIHRRKNRLVYAAKIPKLGAFWDSPNREKTALEIFGFKKNADEMLQGYLANPFTSPLYGGNLSTLLAPLLRPLRSVAGMGYTREIVTSFDGQEVAVDFLRTRQDAPNGLIVVIPGMGSTSTSFYVETFVRHATNSGYHACVFNMRGKGGPKLTKGLIPSAVFTDDIRALLAKFTSPASLTQHFGSSSLPVVAVGFSLGGSQLMKYLAEDREKVNVHAAVAVCAPWDIHDSATKFTGLIASTLYNPRLTKGVMQYLHHNKEALLGSNDVCKEVKDILRDPRGSSIFSSLRQFEENVICPQLGLPNAEAYFDASNTFTLLQKVEVPLLCFSADDDVFTGGRPVLRRWERLCAANPKLLMVGCPTGGHLAFLQNPIQELCGSANFMERSVLNAIDSVMDYKYTKTRRDVPDFIYERHLRGSFGNDHDEDDYVL